MAERRMFSKRIVRSAKFLKMPVSSRELYWQLGIEADDDGIVESFNVMRMTGASEDDLRVLVSKGFVQVLNEDLVAYITDWNENNKLRADRKIDSIYKDLLIQINPNVQLLQAKPRADTKKLTGKKGQTNGRPMDRIGKVSTVEYSEGKISLIEDSKDKDKTYFEDDSLNNIFIEFLEVRKKLKAINSDRAIKTIINRLNNYDDSTKYKMIEKSIVNSWKDVYELQEQKIVKNNQNNVRTEIVPEWLNKEIKSEALSEDDEKEMNDLLKEFQPNAELQERLKAKYGKKNNQ